MIKKLKNALKITTERKWYKCPMCGKHLVIYDDTAHCIGVYIKCKECGKEVEIKIKHM